MVRKRQCFVVHDAAVVENLYNESACLQDAVWVILEVLDERQLFLVRRKLVELGPYLPLIIGDLTVHLQTHDDIFKLAGERHLVEPRVHHHFLVTGGRAPGHLGWYVLARVTVTTLQKSLEHPLGHLQHLGRQFRRAKIHIPRDDPLEGDDAFIPLDATALVQFRIGRFAHGLALGDRFLGDAIIEFGARADDVYPKRVVDGLGMAVESVADLLAGEGLDGALAQTLVYLLPRFKTEFAANVSQFFPLNATLGESLHECVLDSEDLRLRMRNVVLSTLLDVVVNLHNGMLVIEFDLSSVVLARRNLLELRERDFNFRKVDGIRHNGFSRLSRNRS